MDFKYGFETLLNRKSNQSDRQHWIVIESLWLVIDRDNKINLSQIVESSQINKISPRHKNEFPKLIYLTTLD